MCNNLHNCTFLQDPIEQDPVEVFGFFLEGEFWLNEKTLHFHRDPRSLSPAIGSPSINVTRNRGHPRSGHFPKRELLFTSPAPRNHPKSTFQEGTLENIRNPKSLFLHTIINLDGGGALHKDVSWKLTIRYKEQSALHLWSSQEAEGKSYYEWLIRQSGPIYQKVGIISSGKRHTHTYIRLSHWLHKIIIPSLPSIMCGNTT